MKPVVVSFYTADTPYAADAARLVRSCEEFGYEHDVVAVPADRSWDATTRLKPAILRDAMGRHPGRPLLFLDADCWFTSAPAWIEQDHGVDVACWQLDPAKDLRSGTFIQRHRHQGYRRGVLWGSGRLLLRRGEMFDRILDEWERVNRERCNDWGDQLNLQIACERVGATSVAMPDKLILEDIQHRSAFRLGVRRMPQVDRPVPERKVVLMGSAPGVVEWWARARGWYWREGYAVAALNNAWRVPSLADLDLWLHPLDFSGPMPAPEIPRNSTIGYRAQGYETGPRFDCWVVAPYWLRGVRLTVTDALVHLLNEAVADGVKLTVHVAGCDMVYPKEGPSHFYGRGVADPLRYREEELSKTLATVQAFYRDAGATLLNVSGQSATRLPFERMEVVA